MKTAIVAISMVMMLLLTGGIALAAPTTPPGQGHGQGLEQAKDHGLGVGQSQEQNQTQSQGNDQNDQHGQGQDKDKGQAKGLDKDKNLSSTEHGPAFDRRHGAAGVVSNLSTENPPSGYVGSFDLTTADQGTIHVMVTSSTRFSVKDNEPATISDVSDGDLVNVNGTRDPSDKLIAKIVHVIPTQASFEHFVGTVDSYTAASSSANGNITIKDRRTGQDVTFVVTSNTKIEMPQGHTLASADLVTVVATRGGTNNTATGIVVESPDNNKNQDKGNNS